jgi:hypothetical protein
MGDENILPTLNEQNYQAILAKKSQYWIRQRTGFSVGRSAGNPPSKSLNPKGKNFFSQPRDLVTTNKMDIKTFEKEQKKLLTNPEIAQAWLEYQSQ